MIWWQSTITKPVFRELMEKPMIKRFLFYVKEDNLEKVGLRLPNLESCIGDLMKIYNKNEKSNPPAMLVRIVSYANPKLFYVI